MQRKRLHLPVAAAVIVMVVVATAMYRVAHIQSTL